LLQRYDLQDQALMIGTDSSTDYFTGKVRLSCTRKQLEQNMLKPGYDPRQYYLFGGVEDMTEADVHWADQQGIMVVAAVNLFKYRGQPDYLEEAAEDIAILKARGVKKFQIDSNFDGAFFRNKQVTTPTAQARPAQKRSSP
jgi:glycerophosphoryl diester phosphodiesterase